LGGDCESPCFFEVALTHATLRAPTPRVGSEKSVGSARARSVSRSIGGSASFITSPMGAK
jgi:hypothetical protein